MWQSYSWGTGNGEREAGSPLDALARRNATHALGALQGRIDLHALLAAAKVRIMESDRDPFRVALAGRVEDPDSWHAMAGATPGEEQKHELVAIYLGAELEKIVTAHNALQNELFGRNGIVMWVDEVSAGEITFRNEGVPDGPPG